MQELLPVRPATPNRPDKTVDRVSSAIFPWVAGAEQAAIDLARALQEEGFFVPAIRYPTVAKGSARLRVTVTVAHNEDQIRALCEAIARLSA
jgi:7-keto-8-aminopelargonate synthetase-like enzyme